MKNLELLTLFDSKPSPLIRLNIDWVNKAGVQLFIKREDLRFIPAYEGDGALGGNKLRKLKYSILRHQGEGMVTFGGLHSNHIAAIASAGKIFGFPTKGVIRGEILIEKSPTLRHALNCGMELIPMERSAYRGKNISLDGFELIPEGGTNSLAIDGISELVSEDQFESPLVWICPMGTGGTLQGIAKGIRKKDRAIGISVIKGFLGKFEGTEVIEDYHFGGYAKWNPALIHFIKDFYDQTGIPLDPVYTGKMMYGIKDLVGKGFFKPNSNIIAVHTGGLQGIPGFNSRFNLDLPMVYNTKNVT